MRHPFSSWLRPVPGIFCLALAVTAPVFAQGSFSLAPPTVGQSNVADADPPVLRPTTTPCKVTLFTNYESGGSAEPFSYTPPANCPAPWSKVVFVGDFGVTGTNQFDRTAEITIGGTMIYYGTTEEPSPTAQPTWHVENEITDYTAMLKTAQVGSFELGNYIEGPYCCYQYATGYLEFYPANYTNPAPRTADQVLPVPVTGGAQSVSVPTDTLSETFNLPANIEEAYLDVFTQGQNQDEFWWSCVPNDALTILAVTYPCGNTSFRQAEITVDGKLAGLAPIYPYVFTGGFDPYDWRPIPGVQTLNFKPYRINLTPFAGQLDDGKPHTIAVSVDNVNNYFLTDATLLLFQDHFATKVTGSLTGSTLGATPAATVAENIANFATSGKGSLTTTQEQSYKLTGYVNTSHGTVTTAVESQLTFYNNQLITEAGDQQEWKQLTEAKRKTITTEGGLALESVDDLTFPMTVFYNFTQHSNGNGAQTVEFDQKLSEYKSESLLGYLISSSYMTDEVNPIDTLNFDSSFNLTGNPTNHSKETYTYSDTAGHCWVRSVSADHELVSATSDGAGCVDGVNHWN